MRVNRSEFLTVLESVQPGLTNQDVVEQSSCFAFQNGDVFTFNDEIACIRQLPKPVRKLAGAVQALPLLNILRKLPEDDIDVMIEGDEFIIRGKGRRNGTRTQAEILLPFDKVEKAAKWKPLHEDFTDAVYIASQCVGKDESNYAATCLHVHPNFIEACDNHQAIRYSLETNVREAMLVRGSSIKHIVSLDMVEFAETDTWIHFRNKTGLTFSCRRDVQEYEPLDNTLKLGKSVKMTFPKGLIEASDRAEVYSAENADENEVTVEIKTGKLKVIGEGSSGWFVEVKKVAYEGEAISFKVGPKLLTEIVKKYNDCHIAADRLKVKTGKFVYVVALGRLKEKEAAKEEE